MLENVIFLCTKIASTVISYAWFTLVMETEAEIYGSRDGRILVCFIVNHENGDGSMSRLSMKAETEGTDHSFFFHHFFCFFQAYATNFEM